MDDKGTVSDLPGQFRHYVIHMDAAKEYKILITCKYRIDGDHYTSAYEVNHSYGNKEDSLNYHQEGWVTYKPNLILVDVVQAVYRANTQSFDITVNRIRDPKKSEIAGMYVPYEYSDVECSCVY